MRSSPKGEKFDANKPKPRLIVHSMPRAILEISRVAAYGAGKYSEGGWLYVPDGIQRYTDAMIRHTLQEGIEMRDQESGHMHAAHAAWNALARLELMLQQQPTNINDEG